MFALTRNEQGAKSRSQFRKKCGLRTRLRIALSLSDNICKAAGSRRQSSGASKGIAAQLVDPMASYRHVLHLHYTKADYRNELIR